MRSDHVPFFYLITPTDNQIHLDHLSGFLTVPNTVRTGFLPSSSTRLGIDFIVYFRHASPQVVHHD